MKALTLGTIICRFTVPQTVIDEINNDFDITLPASESYETLGGYIVHNTAEIPVKNQKVLINDLFFEIIEVSNTKIELVRISKK